LKEIIPDKGILEKLKKGRAWPFIQPPKTYWTPKRKSMINALN
jgi:hypothetical protein